jgi:hypothetical protein
MSPPIFFCLKVLVEIEEFCLTDNFDADARLRDLPKTCRKTFWLRLLTRIANEVSCQKSKNLQKQLC